MATDKVVKGLLEARASDWERAKELITRAQDDKRELSAEENGEFDKLMSAMSDKDAKAQQISEAEERATRVDSLRAKYEVKAHEMAKTDGDAASELRAIATGEKRNASIALRALVKGNDTVRKGFADFVVEYLTSVAPVYDVARKLRTSNGEDIVVPRVTANQSAAWVAEGATITAADPTIGSVTLGAYKLASLTLLSSELAADAAFPIEEYVGRAAGRQIAYVAGSAFTLGTGTTQPTGFVTAATTAGALSTATGSAFFTAPDILTAIYALDPSYRNQDTVVFASTTAVAKIRKFVDTTGQFIFQPGIDGPGSDRIAGYRFLENVNLAAVGSASKSVAILHGPSYIVREVGSIDVARSTDRYFETDQVALRTLYRVDGNLLDSNAVRVLVSANS
jgi:HK97 family phage major capsid protein